MSTMNGVPGRLWSLWDLLAINGPAFVDGLFGITMLRQAIADIPNMEGLKWPESNFSTILNQVDGVSDAVKAMGLNMAAYSCKHLRDELTLAQANPNQGFIVFDRAALNRVTAHITSITTRIHDGLDMVSLITVSENKKIFFMGSDLFGSSVTDKFPNSIEDISEAGKCLALDRFTSVVFHLMRALETVVIALGVKLNVTVVDKNDRNLEWGKILANLKTPIEAMPKSEIRQKWSEIFSILLHVKDAWRNNTMHPKQTYTEEEALAIFNAAKAFMNRACELV